ncbi:MAG: hypothetical protein LBL66_03915, partial [Clostridiales bacterium]|nr:hypothetical protein [Clostridiales bacterium]
MRIWNETGKRAGVPVFGRDCRVALRAPRNDRRGVRALCNDYRRGLSALMRAKISLSAICKLAIVNCNFSFRRPRTTVKGQFCVRGRRAHAT